ncbi:hypothetical protein EMPS_01147 [Entomortierella parvispora]|uniref:Uncharacterized protein n=1 Tax=Entomortierella parvispora TaxID=205924 RepID=A0A9P3LSA0_9FUNG|nr:hypothetical protein EMPS_01147 [Entomortierella parvispora]
MGRKLSLFCPCLPQKQRDNLSSRSLYLDDSSGQEDYSDDDEYMRVGSEHPHQGSRARLQSFLARPSSAYPKTTSPPLENAWPSTLSNGRFSRHSGKSTNQRKPNPFQASYRDDDDGDNESDESGCPNNDHRAANGRGSNNRRRMKTSFESYHDDDSDDESSLGRVSEDTSRAHAKRVEVAPVPHRMNVPRNTKGKMIWGDEVDEDDAEEVIDVDALLAEQERITKDLAAQEEALRQKEEAAIVAKRKAAIQAAERRGLLRLDSDENSLQPRSQTSQKETSTQEGEVWSRSTSSQEPQPILKAPPMTTPSGASSYVGGADEFDQELKMMTFDIKNKADSASTPHSKSVVTVPATDESLASAGSQEILSDTVSFSTKLDVAATVDSLDETPFKDEIPLSNDQSTMPGYYSTATAGPSANGQDVLAIHTEADDIYPVDPFNTSSPPSTHKVHDQQYPVDIQSPSTQKSKDQDKETTSDNKESTLKPEPLHPEQPQPTIAGASERLMGTFTSIFNTGSSLMGYFGSGHQETEKVPVPKLDSISRQLSEMKNGNPPPPRRHFFDYSAAAASVASAAVAAVVGQSSADKASVDDDDNSSIDDYDF